MVLPNGATLYFLGTNARTAQSYHGNLYFDEYFWVPRFQELRKVASGMAIHKHWRQTYFSTPSSLAHEAYPFWSGTLFNRGKAKDKQVKIDVSHAALRDGMRCADGQWRQIVTVEDALRGGCNLFDLDQLQREYSDLEYANLLMCEFVDDSASVFPLSLLMRCMVDSWEVWDDFRPFAPRPLGYRQVWIGYDPNGGGGDSAALVVVAPPVVAGGKFRVLEKHQFSGIDYEEQASAILRVCERYNVTHIGIDKTGIGDAVFKIVTRVRPDAKGYNYSPEVKTGLVLKAYDVISKGRLEFDAGWTDLAASFMAIKKTVTATGGRVTYQAGRSEDIIRGTFHGASRPKLLLGDDLITDAEAKSPTERDNRWTWLTKAIDYLGPPDGSVKFGGVGTILDKDDPISRAKRSIGHVVHHFRAIERMPTHMDLWEECERLMRNEDTSCCPRGHRCAAHPAPKPATRTASASTPLYSVPTT
ncbi:hypothetical protein R76696_04647 [Ralstonia mannitolilytica]|nr:hypothetical protein R76696_04647 [Ralstonia mannitolilytica]